jgi:hypothetical protein
VAYGWWQASRLCGAGPASVHAAGCIQPALQPAGLHVHVCLPLMPVVEWPWKAFGRIAAAWHCCRVSNWEPKRFVILRSRQQQPVLC